LLRAGAQHTIEAMRGLFGILITMALVFGVYYFYFKQMPVAAPGTAPTQAISITGVRTDLLQIAQAERSFVAQNGRCASLDELISSSSLTMSRSERDGYSYSVDCSASNFSASARHAPAPEGSPIRYPALTVDQTMQVREGD
jgi:hypothetical protein